MEVISAMAIVALGLKVALAIGSVVGVTTGVEWFNKKTYTFKSKKKGGDINDDTKYETEKFHRNDLK